MSPEPLTVLHTSDYQVGRPYLPEAADASARQARVPRTPDEAKVES